MPADVSVTVDPDLRTVLYVWWNRRSLDRINDPLAAENADLPRANTPVDELPPADPILARAIDLCRNPERVSSLFVDTPPTPPANGGSGR